MVKLSVDQAFLKAEHLYQNGSIDNVTVQLAGSLCVDTRVLLPFAPDDRWGIKQSDSYWYDSLTLYRQETPGNWQKPLTKLKPDLVSFKLIRVMCNFETNNPTKPVELLRASNNSN